MGRPATGRNGRIESVYLPNHIRKYLDEHDLKVTQALDEWYDGEMESKEVDRLEAELLKARQHLKELEGKLEVAKRREERIKRKG